MSAWLKNKVNFFLWRNWCQCHFYHLLKAISKIVNTAIFVCQKEELHGRCCPNPLRIFNKWKFTGHRRPSVFKSFFKRQNPNRASCANLDTQILKDEIWQSCHQCIQILFLCTTSDALTNCRDGLDVFRKPDKVPHFSL